MTEQQNIEWKQSWRDVYLQSVCAFANTEGGTLIIGKDDQGRTVGLKKPEKLLEDLPSKVKAHLGIIPSVQILEDEGLYYIELSVHSYSNPISYQGKYYTRSGSTTHELNGLELNDFLLAKSGKTWDEAIEDRATLDDIDPDSMDTLLADGSDSGRLPDTDDLSPLEILQKLRLASDEKIKRAGIILFGKDPNQYVPNSKVRIGKFGEDSEDLLFQEILEGNVVFLLAEVQNQLNYKFLTRPVDFKGMMRQETDEYPVAALREMLLNALVHKRQNGAAVQIRVFDNRISIWNEGSLPTGMTIESLREEHNSIPPNPIIADVCFKAGYIDNWGRGTLKIFKSCKDAGLPEPRIIEKDGGIEVTVYKESKEKIRDDYGTIAEQLRNDFGTISEQIRNKFGTKVEATFKVIFQHPDYTAEKIAKELDVTSRTIENHQAKLKDAGYIKRIGDKVGGYWKIKTI